MAKLRRRTIEYTVIWCAFNVVSTCFSMKGLPHIDSADLDKVIDEDEEGYGVVNQQLIIIITDKSIQ